MRKGIFKGPVIFTDLLQNGSIRIFKMEVRNTGLIAA